MVGGERRWSCRDDRIKSICKTFLFKNLRSAVECSYGLIEHLSATMSRDVNERGWAIASMSVAYNTFT